MAEKKNKPFFDDKDYRREYKLGETDLIGVHVPANHEHPAYSPPFKISLTKGKAGSSPPTNKS